MEGIVSERPKALIVGVGAKAGLGLAPVRYDRGRLAPDAPTRAYKAVGSEVALR
jgi:hypothetical protein